MKMIKLIKFIAYYYKYTSKSMEWTYVVFFNRKQPFRAASKHESSDIDFECKLK